MSWLERINNRMDAVSSRSQGLDKDEEQMDNLVDTLQNELAETHVRIASYGATIRECSERAEEILERAQRRHDEAKLAILNHDDHAARLALTEEQDIRRQYDVAIQSRDQAEDLLFQMRTHMTSLENQIHELESRRDEYKARIQTAELAKMTADIKAGIDSRGRIWQRVEEKVVRMELEASAHEEVADLSNRDASDNGSHNQSVDDMLHELRTMLKDEPPTT